MAVTIRLKRIGKKKHPYYRIVVQDSRRAPVGNIIEEVGTHLATVKEPVTNWKEARVKEWLKRGAVPSDTVRSLLKKANLH